MLNCPFCGFDLTRASLNGERCPSCGARLIWDDDLGDSGPSRPAPHADLPRSPVVEDRGPSIKEVLNAFFARSHAPVPQKPEGEQSANSPATPGSAPDGPSAFDETSGGEAPPIRPLPQGDYMRTIDPRELSPEQSEQLASVWRPVIPDQASVRMTLKADTQRTAISGDLIIPARNLQQAESMQLESADYRLLSWIGEGGVGIVHAARQVSINRTVAVKTLKPQIADDPDHRSKFLIEAVVTGDLDHPNIVPIYELGMDQSNALFYSMKRVQGTPWSDVIRSKSTSENLDILMNVADAIAFAHSRGVVHRDLKPENIMLGDFGEVLVMDWGIALSTSAFLKSGSITQSSSMGGTPAYMAPEMATGPLDSIGTHSDVYLLGAILFEIIAGHPPHTGSDVLQCLRAVARNEVVPTDKSGELLDVAYRAMATKTSDRYASVQEFQGAIRLYQAHSESIVLSQNAAENLSQARQTLDYQDFSRSVFAYQEALAIWSENGPAQLGLREAKFAYAQAAYQKSDFDLGQSLLDPNDPEHAQLLREIDRAQEDRTARQRRLKRARQTVRALAALVFLVISVALFLVIDAMNDAKTSLAKEEEAKGVANRERVKANESAQAALKSANDAATSEKTALAAKDDALDAKRQAEDAKRNAEAASYVAEIGLAADRIGNNAFLDASRLLDEYVDGARDHYRNWEWGHLQHLCGQGQKTWETDGRVESISCSADGSWLVVGSSNGQLLLWDHASGEMRELSSQPSPVCAVAISPDGQFVASGGGEKPGMIQIWRRAEDGQFEPQRPLEGHAAELKIFSLRFSADGASVLSGSEDETARLWKLQDRSQTRVFRAHSGPVYAAAFHPDGARVVTAGEDGTVRIWPLRDSRSDAASAEETSESAGQRIRFIGHKGAVYAADFSPDGRWIASAGHDGQILVWDWSSAVEALRDRPQIRRSEQIQSPETILKWNGNKVLVLRFESLAYAWSNETGERLRAGRTLSIGGDYMTAQVTASIESPEADGASNRIESETPSKAELMEMFTVESTAGGGDSQDAGMLNWEFDCDKGVFDYLPTGATARLTYTVDVAGASAADRERGGTGRGEASETVTIEITKETDGLVVRDGLDTQGLDIGLRVLSGHSAEIRSLAFFDQFDEGTRSYLISCGHDNTVKVWDLQAADDPAQGVLTLRGHGGWVRSVAVLPDDSTIASGGYDRQLKIWDPKNYEEVRILSGQNDMIADASLSVDGRRVITAGRNGIAYVWDIASGRQVVELREVDQGTSAVGQGELPPAKLDEGHEFLVSNAIFFPRSDPRLLTSAGDGTVRLWNYRTGGQLSSFTGTGSNAVMTLSDDGRWLLTGGRDSEAQLWDVENDQEPLATLGGHRLEVTALAISHGGELSERTILTADASGLGKLWRLSAQDGRWECFRELTAHLSGEPITAAAFLPDNRRLLTASQDFAVLQWELPTGKLIENVSLAHPGGVRAMDVSSDGRRVVTVCSVPESGTNRSTSGNQYQLSLWDAPNAVQLVRQVRTAEMVTSIALSRDARSALVVEADRGASGQVFRWEFDSNRYDRLWNDRVRLGAVWTAAESREPGYVVTVGGSHARLWRDDGELAQSFSRHGPLNAAAFSPSGTLAVTADIYGTVKIWNVDQLNSSASVAWTKPTAHGKARSPHAVNSAVFGPRPIDGDWVLLTAGDDNTARLWRIGDDGLAQLSTLSDHAGAVQQAVFSRDGKRIATASSDGTVMIWDASNPEMVTRERVLRSGGAGSLGLTCIRFSPDGKRVVIGSEDNMAEIWEVQNPMPPMLLKGHTASLTSVAFSPDGRRVVSGSSDGVARVWDASSGKSMLSLNRHKAPVTAVEFSSDGDRILTASNDTTAIIWFAYPISPTILLNEAPLVYPSEDVELGQPMPVDADLQLVDPDTPHYGGWTLSIQVQTPPADGELLSIEGSRMGIRISEHTVHYEVGGNENPIGTVQAGTGDDHLEVALTDNATLAAVEALLRSIAYTSTVPLAGDRQIQFEIVPNDEHGDEKRSNSAQRGISPAPIADMTEDEGTGES